MLGARDKARAHFEMFGKAFGREAAKLLVGPCGRLLLLGHNITRLAARIGGLGVNLGHGEDIENKKRTSRGAAQIIFAFASRFQWVARATDWRPNRERATAE
jgi:hypothetical protein